MSEKRYVNLKRSDFLYVYDGGIDGFLCCVFECIARRQIPADIQSTEAEQPSFLTRMFIDADPQKAERVRLSIPKRMGRDAYLLLEDIFLSCMAEKEMALLEFLLLGYDEGRRVMDMLSHPSVAPLHKARRHLYGEAHLLTGFVRFSDYGGVLAAVITPKNFILPYLVSHFVSRYPRENFMIYDKTHTAALLYQDGRSEIVRLDSVAFPEPPGEELAYRGLWKNFYDTVAIEARINPKCRMTHMPKRYWENMLEVEELVR